MSAASRTVPHRPPTGRGPAGPAADSGRLRTGVRKRGWKPKLWYRPRCFGLWGKVNNAALGLAITVGVVITALAIYSAVYKVPSPFNAIWWVFLIWSAIGAIILLALVSQGRWRLSAQAAGATGPAPAGPAPAGPAPAGPAPAGPPLPGA